MLASAEGKLDIVELLLQYGADPNLQNPVREFGYLLISEFIKGHMGAGSQDPIDSEILYAYMYVSRMRVQP